MKYIIYTVVFLALQVPGHAQNRNLRFNHLNVQDGLSRSWVKCFLEDHTGLLWIGTADGLNRFNGTDLKIYKYLPSLPKSLNHNDINLVFEDTKGQLWVGTQAGINYYQRDLDEFIPCPSVNNYVTSIYELGANKFLLGAAGGLYLFNTDNHAAVQIYNSFYVEKIVKDSHGNIWLATHSGLKLFDPADHSVRHVDFIPDHHPIKSDVLIKTMFEDSRGGLWIGTGSQGLFYFSHPEGNLDKAQVSSFKPDPSNPAQITPGAIYAIAEDEDNNLWVGIENGGINILSLEAFDRDDYSFTKIVSNPSNFWSLSNNSIHALYADRQKTMWVGTYAGGADHYNKLLQRFGHHEAIPGSDKSINNKYVNAILDEDKYIWVGTEKGLNRYDKATDQWEYFMHDFKNKNTIGSNAIMTIMRDSQNKLWVGTWNGGLNRFDERSGTFQKFNQDPDSPYSGSRGNIRKIIESKSHHIWIGMIGDGLAMYDPKEASFTHFKENPGHNALSSNWVVDLIEDHRGNIWISTTEAVDMFDPTTKRFTSFTHNRARPESINYNGATCLFQDSKNTIWIGTSNGLNYFVERDSSFRHYTVEDGLPNNFVKAITEDDEGNIWLSTNNSITMLRRGTALPQDPEFKSFPVPGMPGSEFVSRAVSRNREGHLYFGSTNGYFVFDPSDIKSNPAIPKIVFTDLRVNNIPVQINTPGSPLQKHISVTRKLELSRKQNVFTIGFAALNFIEPENNTYAYKLEGFDKQWNYVGNQQSATYTNLDPGDYRFMVRASNNDGLWNEDGISLTIKILPAWWETSFAKVGYLALFILAIFFFRKHTIISVNLKNVLWREHLEKEKAEELAQMKQQFFANVSHEIRTPLTLIMGPLNKLIKEDKNIPELNAIYRNSSRLKTLVDQFLDLSKVESQRMTVSPAPVEILELTRYIMANFTDYAGQKNIEMKLETTFSRCVAMIDQDKYEKILSNLLSNAVKSITEKGSVVIHLEYNIVSGKLLVRVTDNGCGITPEESKHIFEPYYSVSDNLRRINGTGIGLYLVRELVELQKGSIGVESEVGQGSTFTIALPVLVSKFEKGYDDTVFCTPELLIDNGTNGLANTTTRLEHTILVIDDNADMCDYVESLLCNEYNVIKESNVKACIDHIIRYMPDLIISDLMMPEMDGFQLCKLIKEDIRFSHIPIVLLTARATRNDHIAGYETGADDYLYKPFDEEIFQARIKNLIIRIQQLKQHFLRYDGVINSNVQANALDVKFMEEVLAEIKQKAFDPEFNVNQIIDKVGMSRSLFYKKFKSLSDQSVNDLIRNTRLKKAAGLLAEGNLTVSQVAYECGFTDPAYFSRVFKENYEVAPKEFPARCQMTSP
ncbi:MAG TPA: two-component regulator propeller domain-containing protein [Ohtaekwangia sp.]|nr:two-component regulator propeller domain-containing protein [Ohtaekwangia sp.]